jgi:hypothetical protein
VSDTVKQRVEPSVRIQKMSDWTLWRCQNFWIYRSEDDDGDKLGPTSTLQGNRLGPAALSREQREQLESNYLVPGGYKYGDLALQVGGVSNLRQ